MITKKLWDTLPLEAKKSILRTLYNRDPETSPDLKPLLYQYKHNFDFDSTGAELKDVLSHCYVTNSSNIIRVSKDIVFNQSATKFLQAPVVAKKANRAPTKTTSKVERTRWYCDYKDKYGDLCHVWCEADSKEKARSYFLSEYWDIKEIISIHK